jgi:hypothetical protein
VCSLHFRRFLLFVSVLSLGSHRPIHTHAHTRTYKRANAQTRKRANAQTHTRTNAQTHTTCTPTHTHTHTRTLAHTHTHTHTHSHTHALTHAHTRTLTLANRRTDGLTLHIVYVQWNSTVSECGGGVDARRGAASRRWPHVARQHHHHRCPHRPDHRQGIVVIFSFFLIIASFRLIFVLSPPFSLFCSPHSL